MARYCHPPCASLQPATARTGCSRVPTVLARSSYFYHRAALKAGDKYATIRTMLTDITEFQLPAGKVWLSPVVDCFDGKVVSDLTQQ
ncbi:hypothetical protein JNF21_005409 [Escherichia coli]|uniref:hypothetical protein n=1 Tax=Escherichia coli TaxID=562 RepID=UPI0002510E30|nr:hypothetical protein [Escherichia coli]EHX15872.1 hypothetical protein ECDEC11D_5475 [Escherichia coli DEC11D]EFD5242970.1 hypothetical protein [Escherichia coli]EFJ2339213.1 hypothetical protein [Escherichia coli]EFJ5645428.1 hypothetical protein [Escherichia coli]